MLKKLFIPLCFCLFGLIWSCNQSSDIQPEDYSITNAKKYIDKYNIGKQLNHQSQVYTGSVYVRSASEDRMAIYFLDKANDENLMFLLQMTENKHKDFQLTLDKAQVFYFRNQLIINTVNEDLKLKFNLINAEPLPIEKEEDLQFKYAFSGFGLAQLKGYSYYNNELSSSSYRGGFGEPGDPPTGEKPSCSCTNNILTECDSGGQGSSSCSVTNTNGQSCSTSCTSATQWACCNHNE